MYLPNIVRPQLGRQICRWSHTVSPLYRQFSANTGIRHSESGSNFGQSPLADQSDGTEKEQNLSSISSPNPRPLGRVLSPWSRNIDDLFTMMQEHMKVPPLEGVVPPGYQQVSHKELCPESLLDDDGAELSHAPGPEYKFRVWAGGSMAFNLPFMPRKTAAGFAALERFESSRPFRNGARVKIVQDFKLPENEDMQGLPAAFARSSEDSLGQQLMSEEKDLVFFKGIPDSLKTKEDKHTRSTRTPSVPHRGTAAVRNLTMMPTPAMLFRFSALTLNCHAIHLDREFTKSVYGIPDLLVHGPLTCVLMLEMLRKTFFELGLENKTDSFIKHFRYKNHKPLWVNEEITIGCRRIEGEGESEGEGGSSPSPEFHLGEGERQTESRREMWHVWISKGTGESETLAVDGTAVVSVASHEKSPLRSWLSLQSGGER